MKEETVKRLTLFSQMMSKQHEMNVIVILMTNDTKRHET